MARRFAAERGSDSAVILANVNNDFLQRLVSGFVQVECVHTKYGHAPSVKPAAVHVLVGKVSGPGCDLTTYRILCNSIRHSPQDSLRLRIGRAPAVEVMISLSKVTRH